MAETINLKAVNSQGEEIHVEIDETGTPKITVKNVAGPSCSLLSKALEKALGSTSNDVKTKDYYDRNDTSKHTINA